jgi:hypothetical protein
MMFDPVMRTEVVETRNFGHFFDLFEADLRETHDSEVRKRGTWELFFMRTELAIVGSDIIRHMPLTDLISQHNDINIKAHHKNPS